MVTFYSFPESVKFVRSIESGAGRGKGDVANFFFGKKKQDLVRPASVFYINDDTFGITDQLRGFILILDTDGRIKKKISKVRKWSFQSPVSGCSNGSGGFYISDSSLRIIAEFSEKFKFIRILTSNKNMRITGIAFNGNKLFCTDSNNHKIVVFDNNGNVLLSFGKRGREKGKFNFPTHIAVDKDTIYVNDALNFRIQMFDHKGVFKGMFGKNGKNGGDFSKPKGIAVDSKKRIFVSDVMFDNVQVFDLQGRFLTYFGGPGNSEGKFWMPSGIMVNKNDYIFVADTYNSRCQVFKIVDEGK